MPECLAGTTESATEVMGTTAMPKPIPASVSERARGAKCDGAPQSEVGEQHPDPGAKQPTATGSRGPARATHLPAKADASDHGDRHGHEQRCRAVGGVADDHLQVERRQEEDGEHAEVRREGDGQRPGERRFAEVPDVQHGRRAAQFGEDEEPAGNRADGEQSDDVPGARIPRPRPG